MSAAERQVALRLAALHPADQAWLLARIDVATATRVRALMREPLIVAAGRAGIVPAEIPLATEIVEAPPMEEMRAPVRQPDTTGWHPSWAALFSEDRELPPALAASVSRYRAMALAQEA